MVMRQLAVKDSSSKSWFIMLQETLLRYNLPSAHVLLENPPEKKSWKTEVKCKINKFWELEIKNQAKLKSTMKYLNLESFTAGKVHKLWSSAKYNSHGVQTTFVHVKMSVGTYILQSNRARFNQSTVAKVCPLCQLDDETLDHFLL